MAGTTPGCRKQLPGGGSLARLLARDPEDPHLGARQTSDKRGVSEVANDINGRLVNF